MAPEQLEGISAAELAERAGASDVELERMIGLGILISRDVEPPFVPSDVQKVRLAKACEGAGLPMDAIGRAIDLGRLSFSFLEAAPFGRWANRSGRTYEELCREAGIPLTRGQVLVSENAAEAGAPEHEGFVELGEAPSRASPSR